MTNPIHRFAPIAFEVKARTRFRQPSQGLGDARSHGLHVIIPPHSAFLQPPHQSALTTPDSTPWTPLCRIEYPHEIPSQNTPQWPWVTWPPPRSHGHHMTIASLCATSLASHLASRPGT